MESNFTKRKDIRLQNFDYSSPGAYFITICTENRKKYFWDHDLKIGKIIWKSVGANCVRPQNLPLSHTGRIVFDELERWDKTYDFVRLLSYVVMPNHIHIIVGIFPDNYGRPQVAPTIDRMVKQFKGSVTKKIGKAVWQKSFMEHIIRDKEDYENHLKYIHENPLSWYYDELYTEE